MKRRIFISLLCLVLILTSFITGCGGKNVETTGSKAEVAKTTDASTVQEENVNKFDKMKSENRELELTLIPGYLSDELWSILMEGFQKDHPNWKITRENNPQAGKKDQARIQAKNPPAFFQGDPTTFNMFNAINAGVLDNFEEVYKSKGYDFDKTIEEVMIGGFDKVLVKDGERYFFPYRYATNGVWYNKKMFEDNGWKVPQSFDEFMTLCGQIKEKGITPFTFAGKVPQYPMNMFLYPMIASMGDGMKTLNSISNLEPNAWKSDAVKKTLENFMEMYKQGYFKKDVLGLDHTQSQMEFFQGKAAMVLSGSWLEAEMKDSIPEGFKFAFMVPPVTKTAGDTKYLSVFPGGFLICKDSKWEDEAKEFVRYFYSADFMANYIEKSGEPLVTNSEAIKRADMSKISEASRSISDAVNTTGVRTVTQDYTWAYTSVYMTFCNGVIGLIAGNETIDSVMEKTEKEAEKIRNDNNYTKYDLTQAE